MIRRLLILLLLSAFASADVPSVLAAPQSTGLPLPRFVSLRVDKARLRAGPGVHFPEEWVYVRQGLPLEIIAEYDTWRKVRDWQGTQGWMHNSLLSGRRTFIVVGATRTVRRKPDVKAAAVARTEAGVVGRLLECEDASQWCRVEVDGFEGWLRRIEMWGAYPNEAVK